MKINPLLNFIKHVLNFFLVITEARNKSRNQNVINVKGVVLALIYVNLTGYTKESTGRNIGFMGADEAKDP